MLVAEIWLQAAEGMLTSVSAGRPRVVASVLKWFQAGFLRTAPAHPCGPLLLCLDYLLALQHSQRTFAPVQLRAIIITCNITAQYAINLIMDQKHMPCTLLNAYPP